MASITINGTTYTAANSITIKNGKITLDGKDATPGDAKHIVIAVNGNINQIQADHVNSFQIYGEVGSIDTVSGDVKCGNVANFVNTVSGDIDCDVVNGNAKTVSGDISSRRP